jgi:hypothetical protein
VIDFRSGGDHSRPAILPPGAAGGGRRGDRIRIFAGSRGRRTAIGKLLSGVGEQFIEGGETFGAGGEPGDGIGAGVTEGGETGTDGGGIFSDVSGGVRGVGEKRDDGGGGFTEGGKRFDDGGTELIDRRGAAAGKAPGFDSRRLYVS